MTKSRTTDTRTPVLEPRPSCPLRSYGAPLVLQQEQTLGAAPPLISARQHYAVRTILCYRHSPVCLSRHYYYC